MKIKTLITFMGALFGSTKFFQSNSEEAVIAFRDQCESMENEFHGDHTKLMLCRGDSNFLDQIESINEKFYVDLAKAMGDSIPADLTLKKYPLFCDVDENSKESLSRTKKLSTGYLPLELVEKYFIAFGCEPLVAGGGVIEKVGDFCEPQVEGVCAIDQAAGLIVTSKPKYPILGDVIEVLKDLPEEELIGHNLSQVSLNDLPETPRLFLHKMADTLVTQFQSKTPIILDSHSAQYGITVNDDDSYTLYNVDADMAPDMGMHFLFSKAFVDDFDLYSRFQIFYTIAEISCRVDLDDLSYDFFTQILNDQGQYWDPSVQSFFQGILNSSLSLKNGKISVKGCEMDSNGLDFIQDLVLPASLLSKLPEMIQKVKAVLLNDSPAQLFVQDFETRIKGKKFDFKDIDKLLNFPKSFFSYLPESLNEKCLK